MMHYCTSNDQCNLYYIAFLLEHMLLDSHIYVHWNKDTYKNYTPQLNKWSEPQQGTFTATNYCISSVTYDIQSITIRSYMFYLN